MSQSVLHDGVPHLRAPSRREAVIAVAALLVAGAVLGALAFRMSGGSWFVVQSPSMGTAAPVGSLVLGVPLDGVPPRVGEIISFHPPASTEVYTHRVVAVENGSIVTRGDINGAVDGWRIGVSDVVGRTVAVLPGMGWAVRALPILVLGLALLAQLTRFIRSSAWRTAARVGGVYLVASIAVLVLRPLTGVVLLTTATERDEHHVTVASTGMLPVHVTGPAGSAVDLVAGEVGVLRFPVSAVAERFDLHTTMHLDPIGWVGLVAVCALPLLVVLVAGMRRGDAA